MTLKERNQPSFFDVPYGVASPILGVGTTVVSTTGGDYLGLAVQTLTAVGTVIVYDNASTGSGRQLDVFTLAITSATRPERTFAVKAKLGLTVVTTGSGATVTVFYNPKG